jgi:hypothetical protein
VEQDVKKECVSWVNNRYKDNSAKDAALKDMSSHFLVIAFLPFHAAEVRQEIKHWGDTKGFMTQCIVSIPIYFEDRGFTSLPNHYSVKRMPALPGTSSTTSISITSV